MKGHTTDPGNGRGLSFATNLIQKAKRLDKTQNNRFQLPTLAESWPREVMPQSEQSDVWTWISRKLSAATTATKAKSPKKTFIMQEVMKIVYSSRNLKMPTANEGDLTWPHLIVTSKP